MLPARTEHVRPTSRSGTSPPEATLGALQAGDVMSVDLVVTGPEDSIESVGRLMRDAGVRHVPIRVRPATGPS
jgi:predicted transcriptional regulator